MSKIFLHLRLKDTHPNPIMNHDSLAKVKAAHMSKGSGFWVHTLFNENSKKPFYEKIIIYIVNSK